MSIDYTSIGIVAVLVSILIFFLGRAARKQPRYSQKGVMLLRFSGGYKAIGYVSIGVACFVGFALAMNIYKTLDIFLITGGLILFFLVLGLYLVLYSALTWVECDQQAVRFHGLTGKVREIAWEEVSSVRYDNRQMWLWLIGPNGKVKVHSHMEGFLAFEDLMRRKLETRLGREVP